MARIIRTYIESISILGLSTSASAEEIKDAYRNLAKQYHPDIYKLDNGEKFKEINSAYRFLKKHPDPPSQAEYQQQTQSNSRNTYRPPSRNDHTRKRRADHRKRQKQEEAAQKDAMFKWLFSNLRLFVLIILLFNTLLLIDYVLPSVTEEVEISRIETVRVVSRNSSRAGSVDSYNAILNNGMRFKFAPDEIGEISLNDSLVLTRTMIFHEGESVRSKTEDVTVYSVYGIFRIYGFFIPLSITLILAYFYYVKNNDYRLTIFLVVAIIFFIQLVLLF